MHSRGHFLVTLSALSRHSLGTGCLSGSLEQAALLSTRLFATGTVDMLGVAVEQLDLVLKRLAPECAARASVTHTG